jgi:hypothetical protein
VTGAAGGDRELGRRPTAQDRTTSAHPVTGALRGADRRPRGFIEQLNAYLDSTEQSAGVLLPTEAEWERAARAERRRPSFLARTPPRAR